MKRWIHLTLPFLAVCAASASAAPAGKPLVMEDWFRGHSTATGAFRSTLFGPDRQVTARFHGVWNGKVLTLTEDIAYSDGERAHKVWRLTKTGPGTYIGQRDDLIGEAQGFTDEQGRVHLQYTAVTGGRNLRFDDFLQLNPDGTLLNSSSVSYYFLHVGDVELHFRHGGRAQ